MTPSPEIVKCSSCRAEFDADTIQYDEPREKFICPECGSENFAVNLTEV